MSEGFIDAEGQGVSQGGSFKEILNRHLERILILGSSDFSGGYFKEIYSANNPPVTTWIPDSLEQYVNSVKTLADTLHAHFADVKHITDFEDNLSDTIREESIKSAGTTENGMIDAKKANSILRKQKAKYYRKLFRMMCDFLKSKNYLEIGGYTDE